MKAVALRRVNPALEYLWLSVAAIILAMVASTTAFAQAANTAPKPEQAQAFIRTVADEALAVIRDKNRSAADRKEELRKIMKREIAMDYIATVSLGRYSRPDSARTPEARAAHPALMTEYRALFPDFVYERLYDILISQFDNSSIDVVSTTPIGSTDVFVNTRVNRPGQQPVLADWRVRADKSGQLKVIDVRAEGVSLTVTQRDDFAVILSQGGLGTLVEEMKKQIKTEQSNDDAIVPASKAQ